MAKEPMTPEFWSWEDILSEAFEAQAKVQHFEEHLDKVIVVMHDAFKLTFRDIGYHLDMAHSWVFKRYKRAKERE